MVQTHAQAIHNLSGGSPSLALPYDQSSDHPFSQVASSRSSQSRKSIFIPKDKSEDTANDILYVLTLCGAELLSCVKDGSIFSTIELMSEQYAQVVVIIEGSPYDFSYGVMQEAVDNFMAWISVSTDVSLLFSPDAHRTSKLIRRIADHHRRENVFHAPLRLAKPKETGARARYLVEGLPGVGSDTAIALLKYFGSVHAVFSASEADLCKVHGIGAMFARRIVDAIQSRYW